MKINHIKDAAEAHSNLTVYGAVISILEGGCIHGGRYKDSNRIIKIAKEAMQKELILYDAAVAMIKE